MSDKSVENLKHWIKTKIKRVLFAPNCEVCGNRATGIGPDGKPLCIEHAEQRLEEYEGDYVWN